MTDDTVVRENLVSLFGRIGGLQSFIWTFCFLFLGDYQTYRYHNSIMKNTYTVVRNEGLNIGGLDDNRIFDKKKLGKNLKNR